MKIVYCDKHENIKKKKKKSKNLIKNTKKKSFKFR